ncbi:MAG: hypothetical protein ACLRPS_16855 [Paraprevotella clara]
MVDTLYFSGTVITSLGYPTVTTHGRQFRRLKTYVIMPATFPNVGQTFL